MNRFFHVHTTCEVMNMEEYRNETTERFRTFLQNNGFYIVLVLCLVAIGVTVALLAIPGTKDEQAQATPLRCHSGVEAG